MVSTSQIFTNACTMSVSVYNRHAAASLPSMIVDNALRAEGVYTAGACDDMKNQHHENDQDHCYCVGQLVGFTNLER